MIALGWTIVGERGPSPAISVDLPLCAAVAAPADDATTPIDRLRLQIACATGLAAFVPLRPMDRVSLDEGIEHGRQLGAELADRLADLHGLVQVTVRATWTPETPMACIDSTQGSGRRWLDARARLRAETEACRTALAVQLRAHLSGRSPRPLVERMFPSAVQVDALVTRCSADETLADLSGELGTLPWPRGTKLTVTGPWPALSFADFPETQR